MKINQEIKSSLGIIIVAIIVIGIVLFLFINKVFQDEKVHLGILLEHKYKEILNVYNGLAAFQDRYNSVGYIDDQGGIVILKNGNSYLFPVNSEEAAILLLQRAVYDIRDSSKWKLSALHQELKKVSDFQNISFNLILTDSLNRVIDSTGDKLQTWGIIEMAPIRLGFLEKHQLKLAVNFPFLHFLREECVVITLFPLLFAVLIACVSTLFRTIVRERIYRDEQRQFIHALVHNLRKPLTTINRANDTILFQSKQMELPEINALGCIIRTNANNMRGSVEGILALAVSLHGITLYPEWVNLPELLMNYQHNIKVGETDKDVIFEVDCPPDCQSIWADSLHLRGVLENLIGNALKYSGQQVTIQISCVRKKKQLIISIRDNGFGISEEAQKLVFELFVRDKRYVGDKQPKGYGIGLAYVKKVMNAHHGKVELRSQINVGSEFILTFPQKTKK